MQTAEVSKIEGLEGPAEIVMARGKRKKVTVSATYQYVCRFLSPHDDDRIKLDRIKFEALVKSGLKIEWVCIHCAQFKHSYRVGILEIRLVKPLCVFRIQFR